MGGGCSSAKAIKVVPGGHEQAAAPVVIVKPAQGESLDNVVTGKPAADMEAAGEQQAPAGAAPESPDEVDQPAEPRDEPIPSDQQTPPATSTPPASPDNARQPASAERNERGSDDNERHRAMVEALADAAEAAAAINAPAAAGLVKVAAAVADAMAAGPKPGGEPTTASGLADAAMAAATPNAQDAVALVQSAAESARATARACS